jgi:superfamily II DNA or RNA helicase
VYTLFDYQEKIIKGVYQAWGTGNKNVLLQLSTGGGKTICAGSVTDACIKKNYQVLFLAHRKELIVQAHDKIGRFTGVDGSIIKSGYKPNLHSPLQVASVQTLVKRLNLPLNPKLIIIDEAHHCVSKSYVSILNNYPSAYILGVTATPVRLNGQGFDHIFDAIQHQRTNPTRFFIQVQALC